MLARAKITGSDMEQYIVRGGNPLIGEVDIYGAKNAALALIPAAILTDEPVIIDNLPDVSDINVMLDAIAHIGATVQRINRHNVKIIGATVSSHAIDDDYIRSIQEGLERILKELLKEKK